MRQKKPRSVPSQFGNQNRSVSEFVKSLLHSFDMVPQEI